MEKLLSLCPGRAGRTEAENLLEKFGSFAAVLDTPKSELRKYGLSDSAAALIALLPEVSRTYFSDASRELKRVYNTEAACKLLMPKFVGKKTESVALLILNGRGRAVYDGIITDGAISCVPVYIRTIAGLCIEYDADTVILAHNHPSGSIMPSSNDIMATQDIAMALAGIDVELYDHIIFSEKNYVSLRESGFIERITDSIRNWRKNESRFSLGAISSDSED